MYDKDYNHIDKVILDNNLDQINDLLSKIYKMRLVKQSDIMVMLNQSELNKAMHMLIDKNKLIEFLQRQSIILNITIDYEAFILGLNKACEKLPKLLLEKIDNIKCESINENYREIGRILSSYIEFDDENKAESRTDEKLINYINAKLIKFKIIKHLQKDEPNTILELTTSFGSDETKLIAKIDFSSVKNCIYSYFIFTEKGNGKVSVGLNY